MVKVQNGVATREQIPDFLDQFGTPEALASLLDLSWTDPSLGVQNCAWWPEENGDGLLPEGKKWGAETLTLNTARKVVVATHTIEALTQEELDALQPMVDSRVTVLSFLSRFTDAEAVTIDLASIGATVSAASIRRYLSKVNAANFIDLARDDTRVGVQALEAAGLLGVGRATEVLDTTIQPTERPQ